MAPVHVCSICKSRFDQLKNYFIHQKLHKSVKNFKIKCTYEGCGSKLSTLASFASHLNKFHRQVSCNESSSNEALWQCPLVACKTELQSRQSFLSHMSAHLDNGYSFKSPFGTCKTTHSSSKSFRPHVSRYHKNESLHQDENINPPILLEQPDNTPGPSSFEHQNVPTPIFHPPEEMEEDSEIQQLFNLDVSDSATEDSADIFPYHVVKDEVARFYLKLEGNLLLPASTVQIISEEIALLTELSHHCLKKALSNELSDANIDKKTAESIKFKVFQSDTVFNIHHKNEDIDQMTSTYLRKEYIKKNFPLVEPREIQLGKDSSGKALVGHYVSIEESLSALLKDPKVKDLVVKSFSLPEKDQDILEDFTDGSLYKSHKATHQNGKCLQLLLFQDAFEFNPFGPAKGLYKSVGMYFNLGNLPPQYRSKVDIINLNYLFQEHLLKCSAEELLAGVNKWDDILEPLLKELGKLNENGIEINGEIIPVCLLFSIGDNLGSHQLGNFVQSFRAEFFCRFCDISRKEFLEKPYETKPLRTPAQYDEFVSLAKKKWVAEKKKAIKLQKQRRKRQLGNLVSQTTRPGTKQTLLTGIISKSSLTKLRSINYRGVKPKPSPVNKAPGFHVCKPGMPPCLAHDLFEGIVNLIVAKALQNFIEVKHWFDLNTLNKRIKSFKYKGTDAADAPNAVVSFDSLKNHACETWTFLRLLPLIIGDLIQDPEDEMWKLYLQLKVICEYVCASRIQMTQVAYLQTIIEDYLSTVKDLLPECLIPKQHYLCEYPRLIQIFGPLIRLFTLRFESMHVFFKRIARACKNFINITFTLAQKYQLKFAFDHSNDMLPPDVIYDSSAVRSIVLETLLPDLNAALLAYFPRGLHHMSLPRIILSGVKYEKGMWFVIGVCESVVDLLVGRIELIMCDTSDDVLFVLRECKAMHTPLGYYSITTEGQTNVLIKKIQDLPDFYPLVSYNVGVEECLCLKHSIIGM